MPADTVATAREMYDLLRGFQDPAIQILQEASQRALGRVGPIFEARRGAVEREMEPTKARYQALLQEVGRREQEEKERTTSRIAKEYSRRGIPLSSGVYEAELERGLSPVSRFYASQATQTGLEQEAELRGLRNLLAQLGGQEAQAYTGLETGLAGGLSQLYGGLGGGAVSAALNMQQLRQQAEQSAAQRALQMRQLGLEERMFPLQQSLIRAQIANLGAGAGVGGAGGVVDWGAALRKFQGQSTPQLTTPQTTLSMGIQKQSPFEQLSPAQKFQRRVQTGQTGRTVATRFPWERA